MEKIKVTTGVYWVEVPEANLYILCGSPADSVKHLMKRGLIVTKEKDGVTYESGPNAILLSDVPVQNGNFCNLSEFPVLQMLYRQGLILPNHPNNTGLKPMLIGIEDQVRAQSEYIYRGNYGLTSLEEIMATGVPEAQARAMMRVKLWFAFNKIMDTDELLDSRMVDNEVVELRGGVLVHRMGVNVYEFIYNHESVTVDLNLDKDERYEPAFQVGFHKIGTEYFSIIHSGEGDGWDVNRACMASLIMFQGKIFMIDAGPNIQHTLNALGVSVNEIEGIFHTHAHDDHFAGLTTLLHSDRKLKYFATPLVRASVEKKLCALLSIEESTFESQFEIHDLEFDKWNDIEGLEVMPVLSPHPVETSIMFFRALWEGGFKTYAHLADTVSFDVLGKMIAEDPEKNGVSKEYFEIVKNQYHMPVDLKKIDIGGGLIHGMAEDFKEDKSQKIILSHTALALTDKQKEIGSNATFGSDDVLIPSSQDYPHCIAHHYLNSYFKTVPEHQLQMLLNSPIITYNPGSILIKKGEMNEHVYLVIGGVGEHIDAEQNTNFELSAGALLGELSCLTGTASFSTYRAKSHFKAIRIPCTLYLDFVKRNQLYDDIIRLHEHRLYLKSTPLFGEMVSYPIQNRIAEIMEPIELEPGQTLPIGDAADLYMLGRGEMRVVTSRKLLEAITPGGFFGEEQILNIGTSLYWAETTTRSHIYRIPGGTLLDIPIVRWKLVECYERRMRIFRSHFIFEWSSDYLVNIEILDEQHKMLFDMVNEIHKDIQHHREHKSLRQKIDEMMAHAEDHFQLEEKLMRDNGYPDYEIQKSEHTRLLTEVGGFRKKLTNGSPIVAGQFLVFLENWLINHTLVRDRKYGPFLRDKGLK